jgi:diacylglycerol kinase family enzyme
MQNVAVLLNIHAGNQDNETLRDTIARRLAQAGMKPQFVGVNGDCDNKCEKTVKAMAAEDGLVIAAGGDGTINHAASLCHKYKVKLGVVPLGTFNYFARELGIPTDVEQAVDIALNGELKKVAVGFAQGQLFLNNCSFGLYTRIIRNREKDKARFGRLKLVAAWSAVGTLLKGQKRFAIRLTVGEHTETRHTNLVFVGNNTLQLENLGMDVAECTQNDQLAVVILRPMNRWEVSWILLRGALKSLHNESRLESFCIDRFTVTSRRKRIEVAMDGELVQCTMPLEFRIEKDALHVMAPLPQENKDAA